MGGAAQGGSAVPASVEAAFNALRTELLAMVQTSVQAVDARTEQLEQFVEGLKSGAADPVVREQHQSEALQQLEAKWQEGDESGGVRDNGWAPKKTQPAGGGCGRL